MSDLSMLNGSVAAFGCTITTVLVIWCIVSLQLGNWYVPVSWLLVGLSICAVAGLAVSAGWLAAISFAVTYILLSVVPPFVGFHIGTEALAALMVSSLIITVEVASLIAVEFLRR